MIQVVDLNQCTAESNLARETLFHELRETLARMHSQSEISDADIDEIALLSDELGDELPSRFGFVLDELLEDSDYRSPTAIDRLQRVIDASERIKALEIDSLNDSVSIPRVTLAEDAKQKVMLLCAQMRTIVAESNVFTAPHKRLVFSKISAVEGQVYQDKGIFDVFRGRTEELGKTIGQVGRDVKPLTDRVREILGIVEEAKEDDRALPSPEERRKLPKPKSE